MAGENVRADKVLIGSVPQGRVPRLGRIWMHMEDFLDPALAGQQELSIDHIVPRSRGGTSTWENCVLACMRCNRRKANRLPHEAGLVLLSDPAKPDWTPTLELPIGRFRRSWERFVSDRYWDVTLEP